MLRVKTSPTSSKHIRSEDQWRETDLTAATASRFSTKRQYYAESERDSQIEEGINPVHRSSSPKVQMFS
jgi:hypothetical protein